MTKIQSMKIYLNEGEPKIIELGIFVNSHYEIRYQDYFLQIVRITGQAVESEVVLMYIIPNCNISRILALC